MEIDFIFGNMTDTKKYEKINAMSDTELLSVPYDSIKRMICDMGGNVRWGQREECYNHWNSWIEGVSISDRGMFVDIYAQGSSTDENYSEYFSKFYARCGYDGKSAYHGFSVSFEPREVASTIRFILNEYVRRMWTDREKIADAKRKSVFLDSIKLILRDCENRLYDRVGWHDFCGTNPRYNTYCKCVETCDDWLNEHWKELDGKPTEEIKETIWKVLSSNWKY